MRRVLRKSIPFVQAALIGTLAPPNKVAPRANSIPVNARTFFLRSIADTTPKKIAPTITPWIARRMRCMG